MTLSTHDFFWVTFSALMGAALAAFIIVAMVMLTVYVHELQARYRQSAEYPEEAQGPLGRLRWAFRMARLI